MPLLKIEHKAQGATVNDRGDGDLSVTPGVSQLASAVLSDLVGNNNRDSDKYASMLFLINPDTGFHSVLHYQAAFTAFPEHNRYYDHRIVYEISAAEFSKVGFSYASLLPGLSLMRKYDSRNFNASNEVNIPQVSNKSVRSRSEEILASALFSGLMLHRQLFIQLSESDKCYGDSLRNSPKLKTMLAAFDALPESVRRYSSLAFGVENNAPGFHRIVQYLNVVAHYDKLSAWNGLAENPIVIDWSADEPRCNVPKCDSVLFDSIVPLIPPYYGKNVRNFASLSNLFKIIPENIDRIVSAMDADINSVPESDMSILKTVYNAGKGVYGNTKVARRLLRFYASRGDEAINGILTQYPELRNDKMYVDVICRNIQQVSTLSSLETLYLPNKQNTQIVKTVADRILGDMFFVDGCASSPKTALATDFHDTIKNAAKTWSNDEKIARMHIPYFNLSVNMLAINSWQEFARIYDAIERNTNLNDKLLASLPFDLNWKDDFTSSIYLKIENRLTKEQEVQLRQKALQHYFDKEQLHFVFENAPLTQGEYITLLDSNADNAERYISLFEEMCKTISLKSIDIKYRRIYAKFLLVQGEGTDVAIVAQKAGEDVVDAKLLDELNRRKDFIFSATLIKSIANNTDDPKMLAELYDLAVGKNSKIALDDCTRCALDYGFKFYEFIKTDAINALLPQNPQQFHDDVAKLSEKENTKQLVSILNNRYSSLIESNRPKNFDSLIQMLSDESKSEIVNNLTNEDLQQLTNTVATKKVIEYVNKLNNRRSSYPKVVPRILDCLADRYIKEEVVNVSSLEKSSCHKFLLTPDQNTIDWFDLVSKRLDQLGEADLAKVANLIIDIFEEKDSNRQKFSEYSKYQRRFVKESGNVIKSALIANGKIKDADNLDTWLPKSFCDKVKALFTSIKHTKGTYAIAASFGILLAVLVLIFFMLRRCGRDQNPTSQPPVIEQPVQQMQDSVFFRFYLADSIPDSVPWIGVPSASVRPFDLVANAILDTLYSGKIAVCFEMKASSLDTMLHLYIPKDSIIYVSKLRPIVDYCIMASDSSKLDGESNCLVTLKCVRRDGGKDTICINVSNDRSLFDMLSVNDDHLTDRVVVVIDTFAVNNDDFRKNNGTLRPLGRTEYFLWFATQFESIVTKY